MCSSSCYFGWVTFGFCVCVCLCVYVYVFCVCVCVCVTEKMRRNELLQLIMFLPWQDTYSMLSLRCFPPRCLLSLPFTEVSYPESSVQVSELTSTSSWYWLTSLISSSVVSIFLRSGLEILSFCWSHGLWFLCYDLQLIYLLIFYMYLSTSYWLRDSSRPVCMWLKFFFFLYALQICSILFHLVGSAIISLSLQLSHSVFKDICLYQSWTECSHSS